MTSAQFDHVYAPLAKHGIMAVGIDMPGFGGSDPTPDVPTIGDYAQIIPAVLTAFGLERAALLGITPARSSPQKPPYGFRTWPLP